MSTIRLILGILAGLIAISFIAELIEVATVLVYSGHSIDYLQAHQKEYFQIRNQPAILGFKMVYNTVAALAGGYVAAWIAQRFASICTYALISVQSVSLIWAGFLSDLSHTAPMWLWAVLTVLSAAGIYAGYRLRLRYGG